MSNFNFEEELKVIGTYSALKTNGVQQTAAPKFNTPITPRENFFRFIGRENPMWTPCGTDFITFIPMISPDNPARGFVFDNADFDLKDAGGPDLFGVEWEYVESVQGSMVRPGNPIKVPDVSNWEKDITFPDMDTWDWDYWAEKNKDIANDGRVKTVWIMNGFFERLISFMEFQYAALSLIDDDQQDGVHRLFDRLADFYDDMIGRFRKYYGADGIYFHDDWGSQRAPFFSPNTCREMIMPYLKRVVESCHKRGMYFELHSCGMIEPLVPIMVEAGVDVWTGQYMNDFKMVMDKYGDKLLANMFIFVMKPNVTLQDNIDALNALCEKYGDHVMTSMVISASNDGTPDLYREIYKRTRR
ncbi:MAG: hypothetical protein GX111_03320 [Clostridiales bacterium]|jgi:hypothetical protein|nr:hypothetical protein [Clostridiales bacterium]